MIRVSDVYDRRARRMISEKKGIRVRDWVEVEGMSLEGRVKRIEARPFGLDFLVQFDPDDDGVWYAATELRVLR